MPLYMCQWVFPKNKNFFFINHNMIIKGFPGDADGEESTCNAGNLGSIPGLGRSPGEGHGTPLLYFCLENPHGQRSLVGYIPWGLKELDTTEQLSAAQHNHQIQEMNFYTI